MKPLNILIADDHEVIRDGILSILEQEDTIGNIFEASNGKECLSQCDTNDNIDVILLDISMPDISGVKTANHIKDKHPNIDIIALSMLKDQNTISNMIKAGASGYVLKEAGKTDIMQAIQNVSQGKPFYSQEITSEIMKDLKESSFQHSESDSIELTKREVQILKLIVNEYTNQEIADKLYISKRTVDTHRTNLLQKTGSKNTAGLVKYALTHELMNRN